MTVKMLAPRKTRKRTRGASYGHKLRMLLEDQRKLADRLAKLVEDFEDEEDHLAIERAKKQDTGKPSIPWAEVKKRLGLD